MRTAILEHLDQRGLAKDCLKESRKVPQHQEDSERRRERESLVRQSRRARSASEEIWVTLEGSVAWGERWPGGRPALRGRILELAEQLCQDAHLASEERRYGRWMREYMVWQSLVRLWSSDESAVRETLGRVWKDPRTKPAWRTRDRVRTRMRVESGHWRTDGARKKNAKAQRKRTERMTEAELAARREKKAARRRELRAGRKLAHEALHGVGQVALLGLRPPDRARREVRDVGEPQDRAEADAPGVLPPEEDRRGARTPSRRGADDSARDDELT